MKLYVETMDSVLVEFDPDGRVRFEGEDWSVPTLQERRAILYAAGNELLDLRELMQRLEPASQPSQPPGATRRH